MNAMVVMVAHQPAYLPSRRLLDKISAADVFVLQDDLQFTRRDFQHRNRIAGGRWLTIPVHSGEKTRICDVRPADSRWLDKHDRIIAAHYRTSPNLAAWHAIRTAIGAQGADARLSDIGYACLVAMMAFLDIRTPMIRQSELGLTDIDHRSPSARLVALCRLIGARTYLSGSGGLNYLEQDLFTESGITVRWQNYQVPPGCPELSFLHDLLTVEGLSRSCPDRTLVDRA
ncbi:WbqC family protein [Nocardia rhizosphaerae]|uniref:WbqC family protein n=1 Tax=Nocardia rhizosphaerae TaxID=1691571 RepID=A0ABV8LCL3_9NOCA